MSYHALENAAINAKESQPVVAGRIGLDNTVHNFGHDRTRRLADNLQIGRASCRERVLMSV